MTNLKSVDDYSIPARDVFVLWDCTNGEVNSMTFIAFTQSQISSRHYLAARARGISSVAENIKFVIGRERAGMAGESALSLPGIFTWPEIPEFQQRTIFFCG